MVRILVVDDEADLCEILQYNLEAEGYKVDVAFSSEEALGKDLTLYDLILLDVMMGEVSGFQFAKILKSKELTQDIPIIFITALDNEDDTIKGLNLGADDYIAKPLSLREVKARVKAVLRRSEKNISNKNEKVLSFEKLTIDNLDKTVWLDKERLQITKIEFELLSLFLQHPHQLFDRETLLKRCWPKGTIVSDRTVDVHIARLRKKIGIYGKLIKARPGYGYTFEN
ncbi:MAG: response regulator transcription factor [Prevotella sp.]|nr:response regulator transcription factor [Prevotella sp.]